MIPERFVTEYPERYGQLFDMLERPARDADLLGSFELLLSSAASKVPFGRMIEKGHPLGRTDDWLFNAIESLKKEQFVDAPFWNGAKPRFFRHATIVTGAEDSIGWRNEWGEHPLETAETDANISLRTIRNALAHGNIVYLVKNGYEAAGNRLVYLGFLSKHESGKGYRIATFDEETFLAFLKAWIRRLQTFPPERKLKFAEVAE